MMKAVLFAGASVVFGQFCSQLQSTDANCTQNAWFNCSVVAAKCTRKPTMGVANASACSTESKASCVVDNCAAGTALANITSCSKCVDQCTTMTAQGSCEAAPACMWNNATCGFYVAPTPAPVRHCWDLKSQSTCTAADNCFWFSASETVCGGAAPREGCVPCNSTYTTLAERSALKTQVGKTCTFAKSGGYDSDYVYTLKTLEQNTMCGTWAAASMDDLTTVGRVVRLGSGIATGAAYADPTTPVCVQAASAAALLPSMAFLGLMIFSA